jgi:hypothetical protein
MVVNGRLQLLPYPARVERVPLSSSEGHRRYQARTPAIAEELTKFIWKVADVLCYPVYSARGPG